MNSRRQFLIRAPLAAVVAYAARGLTAAQQAALDPAVSFSVYSFLPDGRIHRLSPRGGFFVNASIRPQGDAAVFWSAAAGLPRIWRADIEGRKTIAITPEGRGAVEPSFDWQGARIVFASERVEDRARLDVADIRESWRTATFEERGYNTNLNLFVMNPDGSAVHQITRGPFEDVRPAFSPNGTTIAFLSNRGGRAHMLYLVAADGSSDPKPLVTDVWAGRPWFNVNPPGFEHHAGHLTRARNGAMTFDSTR